MRPSVSGAAAGVVGVALFGIGALLTGGRPGFDAPGAELVAYLDEERTRLQIGCAALAMIAPVLIWFLASVRSLAHEGGPPTERVAGFAFACGVTFLTLFLADVATLAVSALRPEGLVDAPELVVALRDLEFLLMGMAAPSVVGMLLAFGWLAIAERAIWAPWVGWLSVLAAGAYALRLGTLFTTDGAFAADGALGLYVPVAALAVWLIVASVELARRGATAPAR